MASHSFPCQHCNKSSNLRLIIAQFEVKGLIHYLKLCFECSALFNVFGMKDTADTVVMYHPHSR